MDFNNAFAIVISLVEGFDPNSDHKITFSEFV